LSNTFSRRIWTEDTTAVVVESMRAGCVDCARHIATGTVDAAVVNTRALPNRNRITIT
jgi:hypothetical protein